MDFFTKDLGPSYVPSFAARLVLAIGHGIARAGDEVQKVLREEAVDSIWTLAMVLVQWYTDTLPPAEAKAVTMVLQEFAMAPIAANLNAFRERLLPFVRTAHQAQNDAQLAAAGVYFVAAVEQIGLRLLTSAMKSGPVADLQPRLLSRLPLPAGLQDAYSSVLGIAPGAAPPSPKAEPAKSSPSRSDRFDRADFAPRPARIRGQAETPIRAARQGWVRARAAPSAATPPRPPAPQLAAGDVARAYLHTLGWEGSQVDRLLAGPDGKRSA